MKMSEWTIPGFRADLQGLRAIAVLGVILFHADKRILPGGFVGVDIFFVISGFLIGGIILKKRSERKFSFFDFYFSRMRRIVPAYLVMLTVVTVLAALLLIPPDFKLYWASAKSALYFSSNQYFVSFGDYFAPASYELPLLHTWSLAIEMQFYLILPCLLAFCPEKLIKPIVIVLILSLFGFGTVLRERGDLNGAYFSLLVRAPEFLVGVFLAAIERNKNWKKLLNSSGYGLEGMALLGLILIGYSFFAINEKSQFPGLLIAYPCLGAAMIIASQGSRISSYISSEPIVWIGGLSYSLYLWHWPVFSLARYVSEQYFFTFPMILVMLIVVIIISFASQQLIEIPFRNKQWFTRVGKWRASFLILGIMGLFIVSPNLNASIETPLPIQYVRYADPNAICHGRIIDDCVRGNKKNSDQPILVLGDSHAAQLNLFFERVGELNDMRFRVISASSCVPIPGFDVARLPEWAFKNCQASIEYASKYIQTSSNIVIAAMWQYQLQSKEFISALKDFLSQTEKAKKQVTILWQVPMLDANIHRIRRFNTLGLNRRVRIDKGWDDSNINISEIVSHYSHVRFVEFRNDDLFKTPPYYRGELIYMDGNHLNEVGAVMYADKAASRF